MSLKINTYLFSVAIIVMAIVIAGCGKAITGNNGSSTQSEADWVKDEILQQLSELRAELREIKTDINHLDDKLNHLSRSRANSAKDVDAPEQVEFGGKPVLGIKNATIGIIEFTDYQCPFCERHNQQVMPRLDEEFINTGLVKYVIRDFPLDTHSDAKPAAIAANCAGEQGKYWGMHDILFKNQRILSKDIYTRLANDLNLNMKAYQECIKDPNKIKSVEQDVVYGKSIGVSGTPKFFIGRVDGDMITDVTVINGAQSYDSFASAVKALN